VAAEAVVAEEAIIVKVVFEVAAVAVVATGMALAAATHEVMMAPAVLLQVEVGAKLEVVVGATSAVALSGAVVRPHCQ